jgi:hypothetical protein
MSTMIKTTEVTVQCTTLTRKAALTGRCLRPRYVTLAPAQTEASNAHVIHSNCPGSHREIRAGACHSARS